MEDDDGEDYVIQTFEVDPSTLEKLDNRNSSKDKDGFVRMPSTSNACPLQIWEVYVAVAVLILQPHSSIVSAHVKALCEHSEPTYLCEAVLREFTTCGTVRDNWQESNLHTFMDEYLHRKFQIQFAKNSLLFYFSKVLDDPLCGPNKIPRSFLLGPQVQAFLLNSPFWEDQYEELIGAMRAAGLPANDVLLDGAEIGEAVDIAWDNTELYDDPNMILKRYGGWAVSKSEAMMTPKDLLMVKLTGMTIEQILSGEGLPDSPRQGEPSAHHAEEKERRNSSTHAKAAASAAAAAAAAAAAEDEESQRKKKAMARSLGMSRSRLDLQPKRESDAASEGSHASDYEVDPEHPKVVPFGITLSEMYLLLRGLMVGQESSNKLWRGAVVAEQVAHTKKDGHLLAAAVLVDLFMREQIDIHHWTLREGSIAVAYRATRKKGLGKMDHFLDDYAPYVEHIFRDMRLPRSKGEAPIWNSLEERGVVDCRRPSWARSRGCGLAVVDLWDLVRPDLLLDLRDGYITSARVLYDKEFPDPLDEESNDSLMFCYLLQLLFDDSYEAIDGMTRVLSVLCPPFQKGELFPPVAMVHSGSVCLGLVDRAFRFANHQDVQLALEAAEFNEVVMKRLEETFFLSPSIWETMDTDLSGELSMEEFVEGMRNADVYRDFRKERIPEDVLHILVDDLAEKLFTEVDINMDGTLTHAELQVAYRRRREEAMEKKRQRSWYHRVLQSLSLINTLGPKQKRLAESDRAEAKEMQREARHKASVKERNRKNEWSSEVDRLQLLDEEVDVDTTVPLTQL